MADDFTHLGFFEQEVGAKTNTWGTDNNTNFELLEDAIVGSADITLSGSASLTQNNGSADTSRVFRLNLTGTGGTLTVPGTGGVTGGSANQDTFFKLYYVENGCSGTATISQTGGSSKAIISGTRVLIYFDGTNATVITGTDMAGQRVQNIGAPTASTDAATKQYVDDEVGAAAAGNLPGQSGNAGKLLSTDGSSPAWVGAVFKSANYTAASTDFIIFADTTSAAWTLTLPASPVAGAPYVIADMRNSWGLNNLTIARNGTDIRGAAEDLTCDESGRCIWMVYDSAGSGSWEWC